MNKIFGVIMPYIIIGFVAIMQQVTMNQKVILEALVIGVLIGIWFLCIHKSEGTVMLKLGMILSLVIFTVGMILGFTNLHLDILPDFSAILGLLVGCEIVGIYLISQNQPRYSMTYKYSFRNKRRRYF